MKIKVLTGYRLLFLLMFAALITISACNNSATIEISRQVFTFASGQHVYISTWPEEQSFQVAEGSDPSLSHDGRYLAYSTTVGEKRRIGITDLNINNRWIIEDIHGAGFQPQWSPREDKLLFTALTRIGQSSIQVIVIYDPITKLESAITLPGNSLYSPVWGPEGITILAHDTHTLYEWNLKGKLLHTVPLEIFGPFHYSSNHYFRPSHDRLLWLFEAYEEAPTKKDPSRQQAGVYLFDVTKNTSQRITPAAISTSSFCWGPDQQSVIVSAIPGDHDEPSEQDRLMEYSLQGELTHQWPQTGLTPGYYKITSLIKK
ncbi:MAG: hypothetical protein R6U64_05010 [Bacteroidales bacterium]